MNRKHIIAILVYSLLFLFILSGCGNTQATVIDEENTEEDQIVNSSNSKSDKENIKENIKDEEKQIEDISHIDENKIKSYLSGKYVSKEKVDRRPVAIMFDNHRAARWQSGLSKAEIIYEFLVEGNITRYMGIFLVNEPKLIGPIRSSRPYFVSTLLEYDPIYVRCGGSEAAKADVRNLKVADVDALSSAANVFWRYSDTGKKIPHNLYTSMKKIREEQKRKNYRLHGDFKKFKFNETDKKINGEIAKKILIKYSSNNTTKYVYDENEKVYKRYKDGKLHIDEYDKVALNAKNIIIQKAATRVIDSYGRLAIDVVGKGEGIYITNGKAQEITWQKDTKRSKTIFYNKSNKRIYLNPGITWIQIVPLNRQIVIDDN